MTEHSTEYWFYHLEQSAIEQVLPDLLEKTRAKGWKTLVKFGDHYQKHDGAAQALSYFDEHLWTYKSDSFLAHGSDQEPLADAQPILLSGQADGSQGAQIAILVGGAELADVTGLERLITILDGANEADRAVARDRWRAVKAANGVARYWKQDDRGRWMEPFKD